MIFGLVVGLALLSAGASNKELVRSQHGKLVPLGPARTNYLLNSGSLCKAGNTADTAWGVASGSCTNDVAIDPAGGSSMDTVTNTANTGSASQTVTTPSNSAFVASVTASSVDPGTATTTVTLLLRCTGQTPLACACYRSDGGTCTAAISIADCLVRASVSALTRICAYATCDAAITGPIVALVPSDRSSTTGSARFWGAQLETGGVCSPYIPTGSSAVTRRR